MYKHAFPLVEYHNIEIDALSISVEALNKERAVELAPKLFGLVVDAYSPQFEGADRPLPIGTFATKYGIDHLDGEAHTERLKWYAKRIREIYDAAGNFHAVFHPGEAGRLVGSLKTLPGGEMDKEFEGRYGVAELLVDPQFQKRKIGAAMLHAGLLYGFKEGTVDLTRGAVPDGFNANPGVNGWYERIGFRAGRSSGKLRLGEKQALRTTYYVTPPEVTRATIVANLEAKHPRLAQHHTTLLHS